LGDFELDGVTFPAAEVKLEFLDPGADDEEGAGGAMFPTGRVSDKLDIPGVGEVEMTLINAGNPTIFMDAARLDLTGTETQEQVNGNAALLKTLETIRCHATVKMGLAATPEEAHEKRQHVPKIAFAAKPVGYQVSSGKTLKAGDVDIIVRIISMGKMHHAMTGTGAVAIATASAIPGTILRRILGETKRERVRFGHTAGVLSVGAEAEQVGGEWKVTKALMSRSARRLMDGVVLIPGG
jgi:hypothetical protein